MVKNRFLKNNKFLFSIIVITVLILDQITKFIVRQINPHLDWGILKIQLIQNSGAGFGILQGKSFWLALISLLVIITIIYNYKNIPKNYFSQTFFALFLGGAIGNFIDRIFFGQVTDFINFTFWPAFNIADTALTISVIGLIVYYIKEK